MFSKWMSFIRILYVKYGTCCKGTSFLAFIIIFTRKSSDILRFYAEMFNKSAISALQNSLIFSRNLVHPYLTYKYG